MGPSGKKEEMGRKEEDPPGAGWGQAPGARSDAPVGKLRFWAVSRVLGEMTGVRAGRCVIGTGARAVWRDEGGCGV